MQNLERKRMLYKSMFEKNMQVDDYCFFDRFEYELLAHVFTECITDSTARQPERLAYVKLKNDYLANNIFTKPQNPPARFDNTKRENLPECMKEEPVKDGYSEVAAQALAKMIAIFDAQPNVY